MSQLKNIFILLGLITLAALGYYLFVLEGNSTLSTENAALSASADIEIQGFLRRLEELQKIEVSSEVFQDARFRSLTDFSTIVTPVPSGRANPFVSSN